MHCDCRLLPCPLEMATNRQNRNPHQPPVQPSLSPQCRPHHTCCTLQRLHLILQCPVAYPGLATHTLAGLCALLLPSAASSLPKPAQPYPPQTTCPALPQPQCRLHHAHCTLQRLHLTLQCRMACQGLATHTLSRLLKLWLPGDASSSGNLHKPATLQSPHTTCPALLQPPVQTPPHHLLHTAEAALELAVPHGIPRAGHSHTGRALCTVVATQCLN